MIDLLERVVERLRSDRKELWRDLIEAGFDVDGVVSAIIDALDIEADNR